MKIKLLVVASLLLLATVSILFLKDYFSLTPLQQHTAYSNLSRATADDSGAIYAVAESKKKLIKVDSTGQLVYSYAGADYADGSVHMFNAVAANTSGHAFVLETRLDEFGLKVVGERIIELSTKGEVLRTVYEEQNYENILYRIGRIQSLQVDNEELLFFRKETNQAASLLSIPLRGKGEIEPNASASEGETAVPPASVISAVVLPDAEQINELAWQQDSEEGHSKIFVSSKQGKLYMQEEGRLQQLHIRSADANPLLYPLSVITEGEGALYYIDEHKQTINKLFGNRYENEQIILGNSSPFLQKYGLEELKFISLAPGREGLLVTTADAVVLLNGDGSVHQLYASFDYPSQLVLKRLAVWLLIAAWVGLFIYALRILYIDIMKRRLFLLLKHLAVVLPIVLLSMAGLSYSVYSSFSSEMKADSYKQLRILAANGKYLVDGNALRQLNMPDDYGSESYQLIKTRMNEVFSKAGEDRAGLYNTIYRYMNGNLYVVMDDDDATAMFKPFELNEENSKVLSDGDLILGEWEDENGEWMYALGPIYHSDGTIIGIYETGKDMNGVKRSNLNILYGVLKLFSFIAVILLGMITMLTVYLLSSLRTLRRNVNLIASGQWDVRVDIRSRDEVEELGDRFNMMAGSIKQYVQEVTKLSQSYFRFVPQSFLKMLGKSNMTQIELGEQQQRHMAILVCQMRKFHELSNQMSSQETFEFINLFLKFFGPVIRENGGFTSRYLGAGMLTMFPNDPASAVRAAAMLRKRLLLFNEQLAAAGLPQADIGIAIHTGDVMLGIIGEEQRMEGSAVSKHVQLTLDLERLSEKLGSAVLLTKQAAEAAGLIHSEYMRTLGLIRLGDEQEAIELLDWYGEDMEHIRKLKHETKSHFEQAVEDFKGGRFHDAREGFVYAVKKNRYDLAAKLYFFECDKRTQTGSQPEQNIALKISG